MALQYNANNASVISTAAQIKVRARRGDRTFGTQTVKMKSTGIEVSSIDDETIGIR